MANEKTDKDTAFLGHLAEHLMEYREQIRPLRDTAEEDDNYEPYDESYNIWLEGLHGRIEYYLQATGRLTQE